MLFMYFVLLLAILVIVGFIYYHIYILELYKNYRKTITALIVLGLLIVGFVYRIVFGFLANWMIMLVIFDLFYLLFKMTKYHSYYLKIYQKGIPALVLSLMLSGYGIIHVSDIHYKTYNIQVNKEISDTKILAVSDIHLSTAIDGDSIQMVSDYADKINPDMIMILGDLFDEGTKEVDALKAIDFLDKLTNHYPIIYIEGNHDIMQGDNEDSGLIDKLLQTKVTVLRDENIKIGNLNIIGRKDKSNSSRKDIFQYASIDKNLVNIVLDHRPLELDNNSKIGVDIELSGHTHDGQLWPLGFLCDVLHINELEYGQKDINNFHAITSSGLGVWGFNMRSEGNSEMLEINIYGK